MVEREPFSPSHLVMIISRRDAMTRCLEQALHELNIGHRFAILQEEPTPKDFIWEICDPNLVPDVIIIFDESFSEEFVVGSITTIEQARFGGLTIIVTNKGLSPNEKYVLVPYDDQVTKRLEEVITERLKLSLA